MDVHMLSSIEGRRVDVVYSTPLYDFLRYRHAWKDVVAEDCASYDRGSACQQSCRLPSSFPSSPSCPFLPSSRQQVEHLWPLEQLCQHFHTNLEQVGAGR